MQKRTWKCGVAVLTVAAVLVTGVAPGGVQAAGKIKLNKKKVTIKVGQKVKLKLKNTKKKVKWKSSKKKVASVTKKGVVKGKKAGTAKITARCGGKSYTCRVTVKKKNGAGPSGSSAPGVSAKPGTSSQPGASAKPTASAKPSAAPAASQKPATTTSSKVKPTQSAADTLTVGKLSVTLGMSKSAVEQSIGAAPDRTGKSPQGCDVYIYNPSNDYLNYLEIQFSGDQVVEMSTISNYFCYESLVSAGDSASTLTGRGFSGMSTYDYEAGYTYDTGSAYVDAFVDHQGSGSVYGIQIFSKSLASKLDNLIIPKYCSYDSTVVQTMQGEMEDYINAFRVFYNKEPMASSSLNMAQPHSEEMAAAGKTTQDSADGSTWKERFQGTYGKYYMALEYVADSCPDAFGYIAFCIDDTANATDGTTKVYNYLLRSADDSGMEVSFHLACGFAYNTGSKLVTFATIDIYCF